MWSSAFGRSGLGVLVLAALAGCDQSGLDLVPLPNDDFPYVVEEGLVQVITEDQLSDVSPDWCAEDPDNLRCVYDNVGAAPAGVHGGATFTFKGTGGDVCVIVDPEAVFWNSSISPTKFDGTYGYPDNSRDDGDMDLFAGLSSYYTGSPGVELGDFKGYYTDSAGHTVEIDYVECTQTGSRGQDDAHAGRGAPEACTVDTSEREGVEYTVVLQTFSVPLDDAALSFAAVAVEGDCLSDLSVTECTLKNEALDATSGASLDWFGGLESAYCGGAQAQWCCENPDYCGVEPVDYCEALAASLEEEG